MYIGFFDSGIGGITVLSEALRLLPNENYIYYADTLHVPYGIKPREDVKNYIFRAVEFLSGKGMKALVIACNTATSIAVRDLREKYDFPIIGMEPAVKPAVEKNGNKNKRVLVFATNLTLKEEKFQNLVARVDQRHIVDYLPFPELVDFAEKGEFSHQVVVPCIREKLSGFCLEQYGTVVLGCTHYIYFREHIKKVFPGHIDVIDGNTATVRHMRNVLEERNSLCCSDGGGEIVYYVSDRKVLDPLELGKYNLLLERARCINTNGV